MAVATPLTKFSASPALPVIAAMFLLPSLAVFLGAGDNAPSHKPKQIKIVAVSYCEGIHSSLLSGPGPVSLVQEQAEQNTYAVAQGCEAQLWPGGTSLNDVYEHSHVFYAADFTENLCGNVYYNVILPVIFYWYLSIPAFLLALCAVFAIVKSAKSIYTRH